MQRFRGGLVFKTNSLLNYSILGLRVIKKKKNCNYTVRYQVEERGRRSEAGRGKERRLGERDRGGRQRREQERRETEARERERRERERGERERGEKGQVTSPMSEKEREREAYSWLDASTAQRATK